MSAFTKNSTTFFFLALYNNGISTGTDTFHLAIRRFRMCKSKTPRFSAHLQHLTLFSKFVSKKRENFAISEDFSDVFHILFFTCIEEAFLFFGSEALVS